MGVAQEQRSREDRGQLAGPPHGDAVQLGLLPALVHRRTVSFSGLAVVVVVAPRPASSLQFLRLRGFIV